MRPDGGMRYQSGQSTNASQAELKRLQQQNRYARRSQQRKEQDMEESSASRPRKSHGQASNVPNESTNLVQMNDIFQSFEAGPYATESEGRNILLPALTSPLQCMEIVTF